MSVFMKNKFLKVRGIRIPQIIIGQGQPRLLVTAGMHGDEHSQQLVLQRILARLPRIAKGSIVVLPRLNPQGLAQNIEVNPKDGLNINRVFPGKRGSPRQSERIAAAVFDLARECEAVIDLHNFTDPALSQLIYVDSGTTKVRRESKKLCQFYGFSLVWRIRRGDPSMSGASGTLIYNAVRAGIPAIGVELPPHDAIRSKELAAAEKGLRRIISYFLEDRLFRDSARPLVMIDRLNVVAPETGIFRPVQLLGSRLEKGEVIGKIVGANNQEKVVRAPRAGLLTRLRRPGAIKKKQLIFNIGISKNKKK